MLHSQTGNLELAGRGVLHSSAPGRDSLHIKSQLIVFSLLLIIFTQLSPETASIHINASLEPAKGTLVGLSKRLLFEQ